MKKVLKVLAAFLAVALLAGAGGLLVLRAKYPPERLKAIALEKIREATGREVQLESAHIGWNGLIASGFAMAEPGGFAAGRFLEVRSLRVMPRVLPLLRGHVEVSDLVIEGVRCRIVKKADGTLNVSTIGKTAAPAGGARPAKKASAAAPAPKGAATEPSAPPSNWEVDRLRVVDADVVYEDKAAKSRVHAGPLQASARGLRPDGLFPIAIAVAFVMENAGAPAASGSADYKGSANLGGFSPDKFQLKMEPLKLVYQGLELDASGEIKGTATPDIKLALKIPKQPASHWKALSLPAGLEPPALAARLEAEQTAEGIDVKSLKADAGASKGPGGTSIPPLALDVSAFVGKAKTTIRRCEVAAGELKLSASGSLASAPGKPASADLRVKTNVFSLSDLAALAPQLAAYKLQGKASFDLRASGAASSPALSGSAELKGVSAEAQGQKLAGVDGSGTFTPSSIAVQAAGKLNGGDLKLSLTAADYQTKPNIQLNGSLSALDLTKLPPPAPKEKGSAPAPAPARKGDAPAGEGRPEAARPGEAASAPVRTSGKITIGKISHPKFNASQAQLAWNLNQLQDIGKLSGVTEFKIGNGNFDNLAELGSTHPLVQVLLAPIILLQKIAGAIRIPLFPKFDKVNFQEITGNYVFENGLMSVKESHMNAEHLANAQMTGTAHPGNDKVNLRIALKVFKLPTPIGVTVTGQLSDPKTNVDLTTIPGVDKLGEPVKQLLDGLFKKR
ncbi:MAG: AsmA family protein [Elusimicrobia bacterium]|nr:AsmA family protein [Elusimicrobiota bacterium]